MIVSGSDNGLLHQITAAKLDQMRSTAKKQVHSKDEMFTMKTAYLTPAGFEIRQDPIPDCGDNEILVKTTACGICEGDVFQYRMREHLAGPLKLGHEGCYGLLNKRLCRMYFCEVCFLR